MFVRTSDYFNIAMGRVAGHSLVVGAGYTANLGTAQSTTVWQGNSVYTYLAAASILSLSSTSANDTAAGTGARTVQIRGLDANYVRISENVTLNGQTAVNTVNSYLRVYGVTVLTTGSTLGNVGTVYAGTGVVTAGVPATSYAIILPLDNNSFLGIYTTPAGCTAFIVQASISINKGKDVEHSTWVRPFGGVMRKSRNGYLYQNVAVQSFNNPLVLPEKTDVELRGKASGANMDMAINFDIVLVENQYLT